MHFFGKIKDSPNYERLKNSVQYRYDRWQFRIIGIFCAILILPMLALLSLGIGVKGAEVAVAFGIVYMLAMLCMVAYFAYHWLEIFRYMDSYIFCQVRLDQPHVAGRSGVKFTVEFTDRHGKLQKRDTDTMFSSHWEPYLEDYNNKIVLIGYNEETDRIVIIQRLDT